jgi:hypothetical protein
MMDFLFYIISEHERNTIVDQLVLNYRAAIMDYVTEINVSHVEFRGKNLFLIKVINCS